MANDLQARDLPGIDLNGAAPRAVAPTAAAAPAPVLPVPDVAGASTAELINMATSQISTLVRDEIALARVELTQKGKRAGIGAGLFGGTGALAFYGLGLLLTTATLALALVWPAWLAALAVAIVVFIVAAVLALIGRGQITKAFPPMPSEAVQGVTSDVQTVRTAIHDGRAA
jgi:uncharacterized membrane protein YqjE